MFGDGFTLFDTVGEPGPVAEDDAVNATVF